MQQQLNELQVCLKNINKMLNARGIKSELPKNTEEISEKDYFCLKATKDFVIVFCNNSNRPEIENVINETRNLPKENIKMCVSSNSDIKNAFKKKVYQEFGSQVQFFTIKQLQYDPTDKIDQPQHSVLSQEEEDELLKLKDTPKDKIPFVCIDDPITRYFNAKPGQIIRYKYPAERNNFRVVIGLSREKTQQRQQLKDEEE